ncbi:MAG: hypothetical protein K2V38_02105, partial [Gemmataceae bacterium]|nr:hypothetical protein [Gemmataceae bacterium]
EDDLDDSDHHLSALEVDFADADDTTTDFDPLERLQGAQPPEPAQEQQGLFSRLFRKSKPVTKGLLGISPKPAAPAPAPPKVSRLIGAPPPPREVRVSVAGGQHSPGDGAVLYEAATGDAGQFTSLSVSFADKSVTADSLDPELTLLLFVGDLASPRARVKLADVLKLGGRPPLNVRRGANQVVRLVLEDPSDVWKAGVPALEVVLGWTST